LGKLAELSDAGIPIHWFIGNHDMWIFDYLPNELNITLHRAPIRRNILGKEFYIGHGDGLGPGDHGYKFIKKVFRSKLCQWLFARLHPNFGIGLADFFSSKSRVKSQEGDKIFQGKDQEWLAIYAEEVAAREPADFFIFGHRHLPMRLALESGNIGDWITNYTYGMFDEGGFELRSYGTNPTIYSNTSPGQ
jgi:UDP-2,3-diacylglucosamine hydrolase